MQGRAVPDAAFNTTHVGPADTGPISKGFLRQSPLLAKFADSGSHALQCWMFRWLAGLPRHAPDAGVSRPFRPRSIGYNEEGGG
jgi:hypothetical protein